MLLTLSYIALTSVLINSGISITLISHYITFLGRRWIAFLRSTVELLLFTLEMLIIYLLFHSNVIVLPLMMVFTKRVIASLLVSSDAFTISLIDSDEQRALPFSMLFNAILLWIGLAQEQYQRVVDYLLVKWIQHSENFHNDLTIYREKGLLWSILGIFLKFQYFILPYCFWCLECKTFT